MKILSIACYRKYNSKEHYVEFNLKGNIGPRPYLLQVIFVDKQAEKSVFLEKFEEPTKHDWFVEGYCEGIFGFADREYYHRGYGYFCKALVCHEKDKYGNEIKGTERWDQFVLEVKDFYSTKMIPILNVFGTSEEF